MFVTKLKMAALLVFVVGLLAAGCALTQHALTAAPEPETQKEAPPAPPAVANKIEDKKTTVRVVQPTPGGLELTSRYAGHVRAFSQQQIVPAVSGYLKRQLVDIGDRVKKGDLLADIDAPLLLVEMRQAEAAVALAKGQVQEAAARIETAKAELQAAVDLVHQREAEVKTSKATLKFREAQFKRYQELLQSRAIDAKLVEEQEDQLEAAKAKGRAVETALISAQSDGAVKRSRIESAKAGLMSTEVGVRVAQFALEKARIRVDFTHIRSSYDGVVTRRNFDVGDYISASGQGSARPLLTVQRIDLLRVVADVAENDVPLIHPGVPVDLKTTMMPGVQFDGLQVSRIGFSFNEQTATMPIEIDVSNPKGLLRPGMSLYVTLHLAKASPNAFTVPRSCLLYDATKNQHHVYIVRDGKAHLTLVRVGTRSGEKLEILSGVQATDRLVIDPKGLTGDAVPVEVQKEP
jgi:HlyD family secretion protein